MSSKVRKKRVKIHEVYIISHGSIDGVRGNATGYMYDNNNTKIWARKNSSFNPRKDILVSSLKKKTIKKITFSCCNTANPDCYNIANSFIKRMRVKKVVGFDGGARFNYKKEKLEKGFDDNQNTWRKYAPIKKAPMSVAGPAIIGDDYRRKRMGKRKYEHGRWDAVKYY